MGTIYVIGMIIARLYQSMMTLSGAITETERVDSY